MAMIPTLNFLPLGNGLPHWWGPSSNRYKLKHEGNAFQEPEAAMLSFGDVSYFVMDTVDSLYNIYTQDPRSQRSQ